MPSAPRTRHAVAFVTGALFVFSVNPSPSTTAAALVGGAGIHLPTTRTGWEGRRRRAAHASEGRRAEAGVGHVASTVGGDEGHATSAPASSFTRPPLPRPPLDARTLSELDANMLLSFERDGFVRIPSLLGPNETSVLRSACLRSMSESAAEAALHALNTNDDRPPPFLQHFNPWRTSAAEGDCSEDDGDDEDDSSRGDGEEGHDRRESHQTHRRRRGGNIASYARSKRLASVAASLLNADRVRLYQDCIFQKRPGDAPTGWHADLKMLPLDTNSYVTVWIALDRIPPYDDGGSALHFVKGSHRDFALPFWYGRRLHGKKARMGGEQDVRDGDGDGDGDVRYGRLKEDADEEDDDVDDDQEQEEDTEKEVDDDGDEEYYNDEDDDENEEFDLSERYADCIVEQMEAMEPGDSTWHHGWTLHYAPDLYDDETRDRLAYTASYVADPVRTLMAEANEEYGSEDGGGAHDKEDVASYEDWIHQYGPGELVDHELLPVVWPPPDDGSGSESEL